MSTWRIREKMENINVARRYFGHPTLFSILLNHGGAFAKFPGRRYFNGKQTYVDLIDMDTFSVHDIDDMMKALGYVQDDNRLYYHFLRPFSDLDFGLFALASESDICHLGTFVGKHKLIEVFTEHGKTNLHTYRQERPTSSKQLFLGWNDLSKGNEGDTGKSVDINVDVDNGVGDEVNLEDEKGDAHNSEHSDVDGESGDNEYSDVDGESGDNEDSDFIVDEENVINEVHVNMKDFDLHIENDAEWIGYTGKEKVDEGSEEVEVVVLNNEVLVSGSSSDEEMASQRRKSIRAIQRAHENDDADVSEPFYIFQSFSSEKEFKDKVKLHAIETRRLLDFEKNDKNRVRAVCRGSIPTLGDVEEVQQSTCPWVVYASKWKNDDEWTVKTYVKEHRCLQTRTVKACDYKFLSSKIVEQLESNPKIPVRALQEQLERKYQLDISKKVAFMAKTKALNDLRGDYGTQYNLLRDYILEVQKRNPDTTIKIDVENETNPASETRTFKRIYICLGALKKGFAAGKRDFLGLDGAFMKGPYPRQLLSAVALDGNNGIYPVAYGVVETENRESWTWFLQCLGDDFGLEKNSNFTFISDRQKGIIPAIASLFPCAEHRYCLRHIHENMKKRWRGDDFKKRLWNCATSTNVVQFGKAMEELKKLNKACYEWLKLIPPQHWSRSHFTWRAHSDTLLNNMCESFNSQLIDARDKPIITCLEFVREYLMKKIVFVEKEIGKAIGPLTPTATDTLNKIKEEAVQYRAVFCGNGKYQVSVPWMDQCVVDVRQQTCTCMKWELTGMPCKHAIAAIWVLRKNSKDVGIPETWVHQAYWIQTWKDMYSFKIEPINGRPLWEKSQCPTTLLPPKHHVTIGRPKKKRKKSALEKDDLVKGHKASKVQKSVKCSKCHNIGHNARSCKGQVPGGSKTKAPIPKKQQKGAAGVGQKAKDQN